ncbi:MAG TPA: hypothetical protein PLL69_03570 [Gemmatimonadales bacterium]|nr:hypothetical protein [Gemmatimonadales bacterium]
MFKVVSLVFCVAVRLGAQSPPPEPEPVSRFTNEGVLRADAAVDAVFQSRSRLVDTVDIGDFASHLLARLGVPPFEGPMGFEVTADSLGARISGRLSDFPAESRAELGPIFFFVDSTTRFIAEVALVDRANGVMRFRLERVLVGGFPIPELLLLPALREYDRRYPVLSNGGRDLLVAMPPEATVKLVANGIELRMP